MKKIKLIGLTGQTGAGKSTVARIFAENGYTVINADSLVGRVYSENKYCLSAVAARFGHDIINPDGSLNRKLLAQRAFSSPENTKALGELVHPFVLSQTLRELKNAKTDVVFDAPQLFESGIDVLCDAVVSVAADESVRLKRIIERDKITEQQAEQRINAQFDEEFFRQNCDYIIENNSGSPEQKVYEVINKIKAR